MISAAQVRARVVGLNRPHAPTPPQVVVDANVLYFVHYPNFANLAAAGGRAPQPYQARDYAQWQGLLIRQGCLQFAAVVTLGELVRLVEYAELEALWLTGPTTPSGGRFDPQQCKNARYDYFPYLAMIRRAVLAYVSAARRTVQVLAQFPTEQEALDQASAEWQSSAGDFADALMVANAKHCGTPHILSDDADLLTFDGITVYTANQTAIQAALAAGKLVP